MELELNKYDLDVALRAIIWYCGNHSDNVSVKIDTIKDIFNISNAERLQQLYDLLALQSNIVDQVCFTDGTIECYHINENLINVLYRETYVVTKAIAYALKNDTEKMIDALSEYEFDSIDYIEP